MYIYRFIYIYDYTIFRFIYIYIIVNSLRWGFLVQRQLFLTRFELAAVFKENYFVFVFKQSTEN